MFLTTLNVRNNPDMPRRFVRSDVSYAMKLGRRHPFRAVLFQEIGEAEDHQDVATVMRRRWWQHLHTNRPDPIALTRGFHVLESGVEHLHGGLAHVSPARMATWAVVQPRRPHRPVRPIALVDVHYVSGAFSHPGQRGEEWRRTHWDVGHAGHGALVRTFNAEGLTVVGAGDFNRKGDVPDLSPACRWVAGAGYDHVYVSEAKGGTRAHAGRVQVNRRGLHTDHPAVSVVLDLHR